MKRIDTSTREEHAAVTQTRVLDALSTLLAERGIVRFTVAEVAERSGVSVATIYRHFGNREGLLRAATSRGLRDVGGATRTLSPSTDLPGFVRELYAHFVEIDGVLRVPGLVAQTRPARVQERVRQTEQVVGTRIEGLDEWMRRRLTGLLLLLTSSAAYLHLVDTLELEPEEAADASSWAMETLIASALDGVEASEAKHD
jgi:AcrR family transcriptional regulator